MQDVSCVLNRLLAQCGSDERPLTYCVSIQTICVNSERMKCDCANAKQDKLSYRAMNQDSDDYVKKLYGLPQRPEVSEDAVKSRTIEVYTQRVMSSATSRRTTKAKA